MTRAAIELRILSLYTAGSETEAYNISEIARGTGAAYPHVHAAVKQMLEAGLLHEYHIGKSLFCRVDLSNGLARNLLAQAGLRRKEEALDNQEFKNIDREVQRLAVDEPSIIAAIYKDGGVTFVVSHTKTSRRISRSTFIPNLTFTTPQKLKQELLTTTAPLKDAIILLGYERLLHLISPIHEQLLLLHSRLGTKEAKRRKREKGVKQ
ncbi:hypothetical protein GOV07_05980 [Candidatus Woesearchaeota archaeon]|nr:hypothetical protein [Candidatus Woesearchaeota archaeon]